MSRGFFRILFAIFTSCWLAMALANTATPRAIWIWEQDSYRMLDNETVLHKVETFLKQHHISTLYIYADEHHGRNILVNEPEKYRKLIADAHAKGFTVFALLGSIDLRTYEYILIEKHATALRMFGNVLNFNKKTPDVKSRFDGINIDIEPYLLDDWKAQRPLRAQQFLDLSADFMRMKTESSLNLLVGPAIPFWYDGIEDVKCKTNKSRLNECVQDIYDYVAIMDYRNVALGLDSIVSSAEDELNYGDKIGKKVMIGVETLDTTPAKVTFYGKGNQYFEEQLKLAESAFSKHKSFGGFVIHHLRSYRELVKGK